MAEQFGDLKKKLAQQRFGEPPAEASSNMEPEKPPAPPVASDPPARIDGRSLRKTGRTLAFATRVTADFDRKVKEYARRHDMLIVEVLEKAVEMMLEAEVRSRKD